MYSNLLPITMQNLKALFKDKLAESNVLVAIVTVVVATILIGFCIKNKNPRP
jgi:hypothetical protein